jgi:steroid 5-alpha reductase family enzyme
MPDAVILLAGLAVLGAMAFVGWLASLVLRDVGIVDSVWPLFFLAAALVYALLTPGSAPRDALVLGLVAAWALRLCAYLTWRNWREPEDRRYQAIRARNEPGFAWKSVYLVFGLQALLAWIVSLPLYAALAGRAPLGALDATGTALFVFGLAFETLADWQLARFCRKHINRGRVLDTGLWRYSRHPNYFGECCVWWGAFLIGAASGGWWTLGAPLVMTVLLLKISGVALLEKDIGARRPAYVDYIARTNAFLPGPPRRA